MSVNEKVTQQEAHIWSDLVSTHWQMTGRNPTDDKCREMVGVARELATEEQACTALGFRDHGCTGAAPINERRK